MNNATLTQGTQPLIDSVNVYKYDIALTDEFDAVLTEIKTYRIDNRCFDKTVRFHFQNRLGGIDSFTAVGAYSILPAVESDQYQKNIPSTYSVGDRGFEELAINVNQGYVINTGKINRETAQWLIELKTSPQVFIEENNQYCPIIITNKDEIEINYFERNQEITIQYINAFSEQIQRN